MRDYIAKHSIMLPIPIGILSGRDEVMRPRGWLQAIGMPAGQNNLLGVAEGVFRQSFLRTFLEEKWQSFSPVASA